LGIEGLGNCVGGEDVLGVRVGVAQKPGEWHDSPRISAPAVRRVEMKKGGVGGLVLVG
jgi:hypothetical protein